VTDLEKETFLFIFEAMFLRFLMLPHESMERTAMLDGMNDLRKQTQPNKKQKVAVEKPVKKKRSQKGQPQYL